MKNTVVKITYKQYTENVRIESKKQEKELLSIAKSDEDFLKYEVMEQGEYKLENPYLQYENTEGECAVLINAKSLITASKAMVLDESDATEKGRTRLQVIKENGIGEYITNCGMKFYLVINDLRRLLKYA